MTYAAPDRADITLAAAGGGNRDFVLRYRLAGRQVRAALATHKAGEDGYFALLLQPPEKLSDVPRTKREMIFVVDCSGSMAGRPLDVAKRALAKCLKRLEPDDTFQILRFSDQGIPYDRIGLVARTLDPYLDLIESIFRDHKIPYTSSGSRKLGRDPRVKAARLLFTLDGFDRADVLDLLRSPFYREKSGDRELWDQASRLMGIGHGADEWRRGDRFPN